MGISVLWRENWSAEVENKKKCRESGERDNQAVEVKIIPPSDFLYTSESA